MKAAVYYGPEDVRIEEIETPRIEDDEVLIRVRACGVCSTDVRAILRGHPMIKPPAVLGHEIAGDITNAGKNVTKHKVGDRVVVAPYVACGACYYCLQGQYTLCSRLFEEKPIPGGFAESVKVPPRIVERGTLEIPRDVSYERAVFTEPLACCLHGIEGCRVKAGDVVAIVGDGPIGLMHLQLARVMGADEVIVSGQSDHRLKVASKLGAAIAVNETVEDPVRRVIEETSGRGADVVIVAVGSLTAADQGLRLARRGGIVNLFGGFPTESELRLDPNLIHYSGLTITGSFGFSHVDFAMALRLIGRGKVNVGELITHRFSLDNIVTAVNTSAERKGLKVLLTI